MTATNQSFGVWRFDRHLPANDEDIGELRAVLAVSPEEIWAAGHLVAGDGDRDVALVVRWTKDFRDISPAPVDSTLHVRLHALSWADEHVWAVGQATDKNGDRRPRIERYSRLSDGPGEQVDGPKVAGNAALHGITMLSAAEGWAVGGSGPSADSEFTSTLVTRWDGNSWHTVPSPNPGTLANQLNAVAARATDDVWAVGHASSAADRSDPLVLHWDGSAWTQVPTPVTPGLRNELLSIALAGPDSLWAVGTSFRTETADQTSLVLHREGSTWKSIPAASLLVTQMSAVTAVTEGEVWFAGYLSLPQGAETEHIAYWDGHRLRSEHTDGVTANDQATTNDQVGTMLNAICVAGDRKVAVGSRAGIRSKQWPSALFRGSGATTE
jgi:hypothetical protein